MKTGFKVGKAREQACVTICTLNLDENTLSITFQTLIVTLVKDIELVEAEIRVEETLIGTTTDCLNELSKTAPACI